MELSFGFATSTKLPVDVEIGRSSLAGLAIFANMSENPAEPVLSKPFLSSQFVLLMGGNAGFGGGPGLDGGCVGLDGGGAGLDGGCAGRDGGCVGLEGGCDGLGGGGAGLGGGGALVAGGRISSTSSLNPGIVISVEGSIINWSCTTLSETWN